MGGIGTRKENISGHVSVSAFMAEATKQGIDGNTLQADLEDYVTSSYGGVILGDQLSNFIENAPHSMMYNASTLYRGIYFNSQNEIDTFLRQHKVGDTLKTRRDALSWSASEDVAKEFSVNVSDHAIIFVNNDKNRVAMGIKKYCGYTYK